MKHIKPFNESKMPQYKKGEILVFSNESEQFVKSICDKLGFTSLGRLPIPDPIHPTSGKRMGKSSEIYIIKTEVGKEEETGKIFLEEYPEFFWGYERRDLRDENLYDGIAMTQYLLDELKPMIGYKFLDEEKWNKKLEEMISSLNRLKI